MIEIHRAVLFAEIVNKAAFYGNEFLYADVKVGNGRLYICKSRKDIPVCYSMYINNPRRGKNYTGGGIKT